MQEPGYLDSLRWLAFTLRRRLGLSGPHGTGLAGDEDWPEVWIVSPGGVGTTALIHHLSRFCRTNAPDDSDGRKHLPAPPRLPPGVVPRFVFVSGDEADILQSLAQRGWLTAQAANLGAILGVLTRGAPQRRSVARAVKRQARAWGSGVPGPVLHLTYAELWDSGPRLAEFLDIDAPAFLATFPRRRERRRAG